MGTVVYKYRSWKDTHLDILRKNEIYFPSPNEFNDPFDCRISFDFTQLDTEEKKNRFADLVGERSSRTKDYLIRVEQMKVLLKNDFDKTIQIYKNLHREIQEETYGVFSLSIYWDNILMWSHYSNDHKGFCIGFDLNELRKIEEIGLGGQVNYCDDVPKINPFVEVSKEVAFTQFLSKAMDWKYEGEFRLAILVDTNTKAKSRLIKLPDNCFKEINLGLLFPKDKISEILKFTDKKEVKLYQIVRVENKFALDRKLI